MDLTKSSTNSRLVLQFCSENNLTQTITTPTREGKFRNTLIDHTYIDDTHISQSGIVDAKISDHHLIYIIKKKMAVIHEKVDYIARDLKGYDKEHLVAQLTSHNWDRFYSLAWVETAWTYFLTTISNYIDNMSPFRTFKFKRGLPDWYSNEIFELSIAKDRLHRIGKRTSDEELIVNFYVAPLLA